MSLIPLDPIQHFSFPAPVFCALFEDVEVEFFVLRDIARKVQKMRTDPDFHHDFLHICYFFKSFAISTNWATPNAFASRLRLAGLRAYT